ncbi:G-protein coupled receptor GRL101 [Mizuhopecten yessoensis]|uniref:G-protein coupled receptor GRL101 n=1 Tax=Mizuhopecten yessoensis TaxID=6573 RepID=A0A210Q572_MIZYE|nr:G-protein coupled receptor GRL101 [Mizuhopecten yessoensis]
MEIDDYEGCFGVCTPVEYVSNDLNNNDTEPVTKYLKCKNDLHYDPALQCLMNFDLTGEPIACRDLTHLENCEKFTCPEYYVKCPGSFCLHMRYICDGIGHCPHREDELDCESTNCTNHYRCRGGQPCVPFTYLCDGVRQCPMGDDELHCDVTCPTGCSCTTLAFVCDSEKEELHLNNITSAARSISMKTNMKNLTNHFPLSFPLLTTLVLHSCSLQVLRFQGQSIFKNTSALRHLDISSNHIQSLPDDIFTDITDLRTLILSNNPLASISGSVFSGLVALKTLHISHSNIRDLNIESNVFSELSSLEFLDLSANIISRLPNDKFSKLITLQTLILSNNPLLSIDVQAFSRLYSLSSLQLSHINSERILSGVFSGLQSLTILNLSSSGIRNLGQRCFHDLTNLETLDIQNNHFEVQEFMFDGLDNLQYLYADTYKMCCIKPKSVLDENCFAPADLISSCSNLIGSDFLRVCLWVIGLLALVGNIFVIIYRFVIDKGDLKKSQSIFVINLSISDLIMGIYMILIGSVDTYYSGNYVVHDSNWRQGTLCVTAGCLSVISSEMSTFAILMITIDRFIVIVFPLSLRKITWRTAALLCMMFWTVSVVLAIVPHTLFPSYFKGDSTLGRESASPSHSQADMFQGTSTLSQSSSDLTVCCFY